METGLQWWIDAIGKVGPFCVAVVVFIATRQQTGWSNQADVRSAAVEDQKLRLTLLDRRLRVIEQVRKVYADYTRWTMVGLFPEPAGSREEVRESIYEIYLVALLIFPPEISHALLDCYSDLTPWDDRWRRVDAGHTNPTQETQLLRNWRGLRERFAVN